jgi:hypothetical protein
MATSVELDLDVSQRLDITVKQKDSLKFTLSVTGGIASLAGYTFAMLVQNANNSGLKVNQAGTVNAMDIVFDFGVPNPVWEVGSYAYDIQVTYPSGEVRTWFSGYVIVNND